jgi:DNA-binding NarL/FixJ family response regulator
LAALLGARIDQMPEDVVRALRLLTFCEPLDLPTMIRLVGDDAVEHAETHGLIRVVEAGDRVDVRFNHPMFAEVMRRRLGVTAARRVRGELVRALRVNPVRGPAERIRLAELMRESDVAPDVELMVAAATDAIELTNVTLCEQLARTAVDCGGGLVATLLLSRSLAWQGRAVEAEQCLEVFSPDSMTDVELLWWGAARLINLQLSMSDADAANEVLELLRARVSANLSGVVDGVAASSLAFANRLAEAVDLAHRALKDPATAPPAVGSAIAGGVLALGLMGRGDEVAAMAERGRSIANHIDGVIRYMMDVVEVQALVLRGDFDAADERSAGMARITSSGQYLAWGSANLIAATVACARGRFADVVWRMEQTVAALTTESAAWWTLPSLVLAQSYCVLGRSDAAAALIAELKSRSGAGYAAVYRPQLLIAEAWLAAAQGAVSVAVATALEAADLAKQCEQRAVEMLALHDAVRFGDRTVLQRLVDVAGGVDGRLARAYGVHAVALLNRDAAAVFSAARGFEQMGALLSAADAAAQAAEMFAAQGDRHGAAEAAATAERIGAECGGIRTPALALAAQPLPLSAREREIANLVAQGLSNRQVAEQLSLSTRTVEGHIYNACKALRLANRDALAAIIRATET